MQPDTIGDLGGDDLLYTIATEFIAATVDCLQRAELDVPTRQYVDMFEVLAPINLDGDCQSQLTCSVSQLFMGLPTELLQRTQGRAAVATKWEAMFKLTLLRCSPLNESPQLIARDVDADSRAHLKDGWAIARCLVQKWHEGDLFPSFPLRNEDVKWQPMRPLPPKGGIRGWTLSMSTSVHSHWPTGE